MCRWLWLDALPAMVALIRFGEVGRSGTAHAASDPDRLTGLPKEMDRFSLHASSDDVFAVTSEQSKAQLQSYCTTHPYVHSRLATTNY